MRRRKRPVQRIRRLIPLSAGMVFMICRRQRAVVSVHALAEEGVLQNTDRRSDDFQSVSRNFIRTRKSPFQYSSASRETGFSYGVVSDCMTFKRAFVFWHTLFSSSRDGLLLHQPVQSDFRDGRDGTRLPDSQSHFPGGLYGELQQPFVSDSCSCSYLPPLSPGIFHL